MVVEPDVRASTDVEELHAHECWMLLRGAPIGRLAVVRAGEPDVFPVNHIVDHGTLVFRSAPGAKLDAATGQRVAYEADGLDLPSGKAWSVVCRGRAHPVVAFREVVDSGAVRVHTWQAGPKPIFVRIVVDSISGRRFRPVWLEPGSAAAARPAEEPDAASGTRAEHLVQSADTMGEENRER